MENPRTQNRNYYTNMVSHVLNNNILRNIYIIFSLTIIGFSCKNESELKTDLKPTYSDFENDRQQRNLYGKVKELEQFKATFQDGKTTNKPLPVLKEEFSEFGSLTKAEYFDNYGKTTQVDQFYYNENDYLMKSISNNQLANQKTVQLVSYDTINKTTTRTVKINDSLNYKFISTYNNREIITKQVKIQNKDTIVRTYEYIYNDDNKIVLEKEFEEGKELSIGTYEYDNENNLIEYFNKYEWMELLKVNEWKNNRISRQTEYTISADLKKHLDELTEYDKLFNPVNSKIYENSELNRELKYDYEFDNFGNWIKRIVAMKEHFANSDKFIPIYIESRKIKYWK